MYKTSSNLEYNREIKASNSLLGDLMEVIEGCYNGHILLNAYDNIISLTNPQLTWSKDCSLRVRILPKGTEVKLIVE